MALALGLIEADAALGPAQIVQEWPRLFGASAAGARGLLENIAGSVITLTVPLIGAGQA